MAKKFLTIVLIISVFSACQNQELQNLKSELEKLQNENIVLKTELDSLKLYNKLEEEKRLSDFAGKIFWSNLGADKPLGVLNFLENNKVKFFIPNYGEYAYPYSKENGIITIHILNELSIKLEIISHKQLKLLQSSFFGDAKVEGLIYNCKN